jgi:uncharacterized protein
MQEIDLTDSQRLALYSVFSRHHEHIDMVAVYGSRVQGRARAGSDVDLVIYGTIDADEIDAINHEIAESDLSIFWDLKAYDQINHRELKAEIDRWARPLFRTDDLRAHI